MPAQMRKWRNPKEMAAETSGLSETARYERNVACILWLIMRTFTRSLTRVVNQSGQYSSAAELRWQRDGSITDM